VAQKLISRAELARLAKVTKAAVTKALKGPLAASRVADRADLNHPALQAWLVKRGAAPAASARSDRAPTPKPKGKAAAPAAPTSSRKRPAKAKPAPPEDPPPLPPEEAPPAMAEVDAFRALLGPLAARFSTRREFKDWLQGLEGLERYRRQRLENDERQGRVISRELVKTHFFGAIDASNKRLLSDTPRTIATDLFALAKAGGSLEDAERSVRDAISSQLEPVKESMTRALRNAG
jgi:hypothetical protein